MNLVFKYLPELYEISPVLLRERIQEELIKNREGIQKLIEENWKDSGIIETLNEIGINLQVLSLMKELSREMFEKFKELLQAPYEKIKKLIEENINELTPKWERLGLRNCRNFSPNFHTLCNQLDTKKFPTAKGFYSLSVGVVIDFDTIINHYSSRDINECVKRAIPIIGHELTHKVHYECSLTNEEKQKLDEFQKETFKKLTQEGTNLEEFENVIFNILFCDDYSISDLNLPSPIKDLLERVKGDRILSSGLYKVEKTKRDVEEKTEAYAYFFKAYLEGKLHDNSYLESIRNELLNTYRSPKNVETFSHLLKKYNEMIKNGANEEDAVKEILNGMYEMPKLDEPIDYAENRISDQS